MFTRMHLQRHRVRVAKSLSHRHQHDNMSHMPCTIAAGHKKGLQTLGNHPWNYNFLFLVCIFACVIPSHALNEFC